MIQIAVCLAESEGTSTGSLDLRWKKSFTEKVHRSAPKKGIPCTFPRTHKSLRKNGAWEMILSFREGLFSGTMTMLTSFTFRT